MPDQHREVAARVRSLCEAGLQKYRDGDVEGALIDWDSARSMDTDDPTPQSYIQRVAMGLEPEEPESFGDDDDLYAEVEVTAPTPAARSSEAQNDFLNAARDLFSMDDLYAGWTLEPEAAELPPPPNQARAPSRGVPGIDEPADIPDEVMGLPSGSTERTADAAPDVDELPALSDALSDGEALALELDLAPLGSTEAPGQPAPAFDEAVAGFDEAVAGFDEAAAAFDDSAVALDDSAAGFDERAAAPERARSRDFEGETMDLEPVEIAEYREAATREVSRPRELDEDPSGELPAPPHARLGTDAEITIPGGVADDVAEPAGLALSDEALEALRPPEQGVSQPEDTTVERPGMVARGFALPDLDELEEASARTDDRYDSTGELGIEFRDGTDAGLDEELTAERGALFDRRGVGGQHGEDDEMTVERGARAGTYDEEMTVERPSGRIAQSSAPPGLDPSVIVDLHGAVDSGSWDDLCAMISRQVDESEPPSIEENGDERVRFRVGSFIDRARLELDRGKTEVAVTALELALGEQPDSPAAQKLIHRHKDLLSEIYQTYLGNLSAIPTLAVPMHELSAKNLDSRSVFLLSRIDGTFTFEEILDMSGMSQIEAYRHLAKLLLKGILEVR